MIGAAVLLVITWLGLGAAALVVFGGVIGYFIGKFLDGEIDVEDVRERAQGRRLR